MAWAERVPDLTVPSIGRDARGAAGWHCEITRERDPKKAGQIGTWVDGIAELYRILPVDGRAFRI
jgi:hypothetical protein